MPTIDYLHEGKEHEYRATIRTLAIYETNFDRDLIKDVLGHVEPGKSMMGEDDDGNITYIDYTINNWGAYPRAFWAMLKTAEEIARRERREHEKVPPYEEWQDAQIDLYEISAAVITECNRGLFHTGAADSE